MFITKSVTGQNHLLTEQIEKLENSIGLYVEGFSPLLSKLHPDYVLSGHNLVHYLALKNHDTDRLQGQLANMGIAKLDTAQAHIMDSLSLTKKLLVNFHDDYARPSNQPGVSITMSKKILAHNTRNLLGKKPTGRKSRIMVTLPGEAAHNKNRATILLDIIS